MSDSPPPSRPATPTTPAPSAGPDAGLAGANAAADTVFDPAAATNAATDAVVGPAAAPGPIDTTVTTVDTAARTDSIADVGKEQQPAQPRPVSPASESYRMGSSGARGAGGAPDPADPAIVGGPDFQHASSTELTAAAAAAAATGQPADRPLEPTIATTNFATTPTVGFHMPPTFVSPGGSAFGTPMGPHGAFAAPMGPTPFQAPPIQPFYSSPGAPPGAGNPFAAVAQLQQAMMEQARSHQQYVQFQQDTVQQQQMQQQQAFQDQLQRFQDQFQLQLATQQQHHRDDIEALRADQRRSGAAPSAVDEASDNRRSTFFSGHEYDAGDVEKQLKYFTCEARFHGRDGECIDAFLTTLERALGLKDRQLWVLFLDRQLSGSAASAFQQQFPTLDSVTYEEAAAFLRLRHRPMRHLLETLTSILRAKQSSSVTALFTFLETRILRLSHADHNPDDIVSDPLLVAVVMTALKPSIASRLMQDASKLRADYSLAQLKEDALSIESALKDAPAHPPPNSRHEANRHPARAAHMADADPAYEMYVTDLDARDNSQNRSEQGPRPAYEHADWYKRDGNSCRYCKTVGHNTSCCDKLYGTKNRGKDMPAAMKAANQAIVDRQ